MTHKFKQEIDSRHSLHGHIPPESRLKSRKSFLTTESLNPQVTPSYLRRTEKWLEWDSLPPTEAIQPPTEQLPNGTNLPRKQWVALNRARSKVGRTGNNLLKWGLSPTSECPCGNSRQTMEHIQQECSLGPHCTDTDLYECNDAALDFLCFWNETI